MKITKFNKIHSRIFKDFKWPSTLENFKSKNLIYGWNGTGKSTISDLFRCIEKKECTTEEDSFSFELCNGKIIESNEISKDNRNLPQIRVFNKSYVEENVFLGSDQEGKIPPIIYLGKESVEKAKKIEELRKQINELEMKRDGEDGKSGLKKVKEKLEQELENYCKTQAKTIKHVLTSSGSDNKYNGYDIRDFKESVTEIKAYNEQKLTDIKNKDFEKIKQKLDDPKSKDPISVPSEITVNLEQMYNEAKNILSQSVVASTIDELKNNHELSEWVQEGLKLHKPDGKYKDTCSFCANPITPERFKKLENHFNKKLQILQDSVVDLTDKIDEKIKTLDNILTNCPDESRFYEDLQKDYKEAQNEMEGQINCIKNWLKELKEKLEEKNKSIFSSMELRLETKNNITLLTKAVIEIINEHNERTKNFVKQQADTKKEMEEYLVVEVLPDYKKKKAEFDEASAKLEKLETNIDNLTKEKIKLETTIKDDVTPIEELNQDLKVCLARDDIQFEKKQEQDGYSISRNGKPAKKISEGEKTAIALLYFLKTLSDSNFKLEESVVVIDDPVSSLDSNFMYAAFGFIKERTKQAEQLFILTHNYTFFNCVKKWFKHEKEKEKGTAEFYMLERKVVDKNHSSDIERMDKLLKDYESEYHFLFSKVYKALHNKDSKQLSELYPLLNMARKVLEEFLEFKYPGSGNLYKKINSVSNLNAAKNDRIERFVQIGSHKNSDDLSMLSETQSVLKDILDMIKRADKDHFNSMEKLIKSKTTK